MSTGNAKKKKILKTIKLYMFDIIPMIKYFKYCAIIFFLIFFFIPAKNLIIDYLKCLKLNFSYISSDKIYKFKILRLKYKFLYKMFFILFLTKKNNDGKINNGLKKINYYI